MKYLRISFCIILSLKETQFKQKISLKRTLKTIKKPNFIFWKSFFSFITYFNPITTRDMFIESWLGTFRGCSPQFCSFCNSLKGATSNRGWKKMQKSWLESSKIFVSESSQEQCFWAFSKKMNIEPEGILSQNLFEAQNVHLHFSFSDLFEDSFF